MAISATTGMQLGPFEIEAEVARGGMSMVYRARHTGLQIVVAVKAMK